MITPREPGCFMLGGVAIASLTAVALSHRRFFTAAHQLREPAG